MEGVEKSVVLGKVVSLASVCVRRDRHYVVESVSTPTRIILIVVHVVLCVVVELRVQRGRVSVRRDRPYVVDSV